MTERERGKRIRAKTAARLRLRVGCRGEGVRGGARACSPKGGGGRGGRRTRYRTLLPDDGVRPSVFEPRGARPPPRAYSAYTASVNTRTAHLLRAAVAASRRPSFAHSLPEFVRACTRVALHPSPERVLSCSRSLATVVAVSLHHLKYYRRGPPVRVYRNTPGAL